MQFKSLEGRIVTLFLVLLVAVQLMGLMFVRFSVGENARSVIADELQVGERVFRKLLQQRAEKLTSAARFLAVDFGFRQAVTGDGDSDMETVISVLQNQQGRINAAFVAYINRERQIISSTMEIHQSLGPLVFPLLDQAERTGGASVIKRVDQGLYQIVVVPVKAPILVGWVVMAFPINETIINEMRELSGLDLVILNRGTPWKVQVGTLNVDGVMSNLEKLPNSSEKLPSLQIGGSEYGAKVYFLGDERGAVVVLLNSVSRALFPYQRLQLMLLILSLLGLILAAVASVLTAKRITQPLSKLANIAQHMGQGDYTEQIEFGRKDEIGALALAFSTMREGIAKRELEISRLAYWDTLTNLPNRLQFTRLLHEAMTHGNCCVLMMDLDRFKFVNDVLGHTVGDALLCEVGQRLLSLFENQPEVVVARFGGDEFVILLPQADLASARQVAERVLQALSRPLIVDEQRVDVGAGLGIAAFPDHGQTADGVLGLAEVAMYYAKRHHSGAVVYDTRIDTSSAQNLSLLSELRHANEHHEFRLFAQPKLEFGTGMVVGLEALIRWQHPLRGLVPPDQFISFAEQTDFIRVLTHWVMEQSAVLCQQMLSEGFNLKISVNLSTRDLLDQDLPKQFEAILSHYQVQASSFCLEITESAMMDDPVRAQHTLERLHAMQFDLSIDDFGTGYSSLAYLKRLPVNELKIDKSFVLNLAQDQGDAKIVCSTIDLGHNMGLRVVAEGVETEAVWHLLAQLGCDQGQGFFMSRPIPVAQLPDWIRAWKAPQQEPNFSSA